MGLFVFSSFHAAILTLENDQKTELRIYHTPGSLASFLEKRSTAPVAVAKGKSDSLRIHLGGHEIRSLRLDFGSQPATVRLYQLQLKSYFGKTLILGPDYPGNNLIPSADLSLAQDPDALVIKTRGRDPYLIFKDIPRLDPGPAGLVLPLLIALLVYVYFPPHFRKFSVWRDTFDRRPSSGINYDALDGLRGLAAIFVLASHAGIPGCSSLGIVGVVVFFVLSGFLLVMPYTDDSKKILSRSYLKNYLGRRMARIVPMYYFYILIAYFFSQRLGDALRTAAFLQGNSILWTVLQEVHFYLLLPFILLANHLLFRGNNGRTSLFLLILALAFSAGLLETHRMYGNGASLPLYAAVFLSGMAASYCNNAAFSRRGIVQKILAMPLVSLLLFLFLPGASLLGLAVYGEWQNPVWLLNSYYCYPISLLVLCLVRAPQSLLSRFLQWPFLRLMGTISYSFYLLHPGCLLVVKELMVHLTGTAQKGVMVFLPTLLLTCILSTMTYTLIERPFIRRHKSQ